MTLSFRPLLARLRDRFAPTDLTRQAVQTIELSPPIISNRPPAISLPGEFDRAVAYTLGREMELGRVAGGQERLEGATIAYALPDALIAHGVVYAGSASEVIRRKGEPKLCFIGPPERRESGLLAANRITEIFFGDWLVEFPGLCLLAEQMDLAAVTFEKNPWPHEAGYRSLLDTSSDPVRHARFETLWIVDDRGINHGRTARFRELRKRIAGKTKNEAGARRVYLARGRLGEARNVVNVAELEAELAALDFAIVHPERETPFNLACKLASATIVVTVEGSAQVHALLAMPDEAVLIALQQPDRFTAPGKDMADMAGLRYGFTVGDVAPGGFSIDLSRLRETIAIVERTL